VNTTASWLCTTASQVLCRRSRGPRSKAQETRYPALIARRLREWDIKTGDRRDIRQFPFVEQLGNVPSVPIFPLTQNFLLLRRLPLGLVTVTKPVVARAGTAVLISELDFTVNAAEGPLKLMLLTPVRSVPKM
jgi:hypothetical protein